MLVRSTVTRLRLRVHTQSQGSRSLRLAVRARNPRGLRWFEAKLARSALLARRCDSLWPQSAWTRRATLPGTHRTVVLSVDADVVLVCCGGGGLVGAVAAALRLAHSKARSSHRGSFTAPHRTAQPDSVAAEAVGHVAAAPTDSCTTAPRGAIRDQCNTCNACVHGLSSCANACGCIGAHLRGRAGERAVNVS